MLYHGYQGCIGFVLPKAVLCIYSPRNTLLQLEAVIQPVRLYYGEPFVSKWRYKIPCVGFPKIDSICFINSILSGRDRLDVLYQLDFIDFIW